MSPKIPAKIKNVFHPHPIFPENKFLETEDEQPLTLGRDQSTISVRVRALDGFLFVRNGKFVYPTRDKSENWWIGVEAYGYVAAVTGDYKWFIWAGRWDEDFEGKHIEVLHLKNLRGLQKERHSHWRGGLEDILWLDTWQNFSYALLEPDESYNCGQWPGVVRSWTKLPKGQSQADPSFVTIEPDDDRPVWWTKPGDKAWNHMIKVHKREEAEETKTRRASAGGKHGSSSSTKGKQTINSKKGSQPKRKAASNAKSSQKRQGKKARHEETSSESEAVSAFSALTPSEIPSQVEDSSSSEDGDEQLTTSKSRSGHISTFARKKMTARRASSATRTGASGSRQHQVTKGDTTQATSATRALPKPVSRPLTTAEQPDVRQMPSSSRQVAQSQLGYMVTSHQSVGDNLVLPRAAQGNLGQVIQGMGEPVGISVPTATQVERTARETPSNAVTYDSEADLTEPKTSAPPPEKGRGTLDPLSQADSTEPDATISVSALFDTAQDHHPEMVIGDGQTFELDNREYPEPNRQT